MEIDGKKYKRLVPTHSIPLAKAIVIEDGAYGDLAIFHHNGEYYVTSNVCPHHHASVLVHGFVENCTVTCPLHGYEYDLETGASLSGGADIKIYPHRIIDGDIYIEDGEASLPKWMMNF